MTPLRRQSIRAIALMSRLSRDAGGPFESVRGLCAGLEATERVSVCAIGTLNKNYLEDLNAWRGLNVLAARSVGPSRFAVAPGVFRSIRNAKADILHLHGLWSFASLGLRQWRREGRGPYLISPHGMVDGWALRNSGRKKAVAYALFERQNLEEASCIRTLCASETAAVRAFGLSNPVCEIPNGVSLVDEPTGEPAWRDALPKDARILLFLGRIHPKKQIAVLINAWAEARAGMPGAEPAWYLVIAGWDDGGHETGLRELATRLGVRGVLFVGPQFGPERSRTYAAADAFILPSISEGLPMSILEAWSFGLPVLMTEECNLPEGFREGAAWQMSCDVPGVVLGLRCLFASTGGERRVMGSRGRALVERRFTWLAIGESMASVYEWLLGRRERPEAVRLPEAPS